MDKRQQHSLQYLILPSSILVAYNVAEGMLISKCLKLRNMLFHLTVKQPRVWIDINQARRPSKLYFVKILLIDRFYSHVF